MNLAAGLARQKASSERLPLLCVSTRIYPRQRQSRGSRVFTGVCLSVYPHGISKTDAAKIIKLANVHDESWKPIYFEIKRTKVKVTSAGVGRCTLVSAVFF